MFLFGLNRSLVRLTGFWGFGWFLVGLGGFWLVWLDWYFRMNAKIYRFCAAGEYQQALKCRFIICKTHYFNHLFSKYLSRSNQI